jgi:hypothetical protein
MTMKGDELTVQFRNLLKKAAARQGLTQAGFVVDAVTQAAQASSRAPRSSSAGAQAERLSVRPWWRRLAG